jgi:hypothetical protein
MVIFHAMLVYQRVYTRFWGAFRPEHTERFCVYGTTVHLCTDPPLASSKN